MNNNGISFTCDSCGREVYGCNIVNGMKFCAKCYQETFGNEQKYKERDELLVNSLTEKDRQIAELQKQLEEKEKIIQMQQNIKRYDIGEILTENVKLKQQLKSQPKEIVEKIKKGVLKIDKIEIKTLDNGYSTLYCDRPGVIIILDTILKEYQK